MSLFLKLENIYILISIVILTVLSFYHFMIYLERPFKKKNLYFLYFALFLIFIIFYIIINSDFYKILISNINIQERILPFLTILLVILFFNFIVKLFDSLSLVYIKKLLYFSNFFLILGLLISISSIILGFKFYTRYFLFLENIIIFIGLIVNFIFYVYKIIIEKKYKDNIILIVFIGVSINFFSLGINEILYALDYSVFIVKNYM